MNNTFPVGVPLKNANIKISGPEIFRGEKWYNMYLTITHDTDHTIIIPCKDSLPLMDAEMELALFQGRARYVVIDSHYDTHYFYAKEDAEAFCKENGIEKIYTIKEYIERKYES